jgi:hypothetical protein
VKSVPSIVVDSVDTNNTGLPDALRNIAGTREHDNKGRQNAINSR